MARIKSFKNKGRLDEADKNLPDIIEKLSKFTKRLKIINLSSDMKSDWVKEYGPIIVYRRVWEKLGLDRYIKKRLNKRKIGFDAERLIYTMVLNRLMEPKSELAIHDWSRSLYGIKPALGENPKRRLFL